MGTGTISTAAREELPLTVSRWPPHTLASARRRLYLWVERKQIPHLPRDGARNIRFFEIGGVGALPRNFSNRRWWNGKTS